jgi:hypothetical protein
MGLGYPVSRRNPLLMARPPKVLRDLWRGRADLRMVYVFAVESPELLLAAESRTCPFCGRRFRSKWGLLLHLSKHPVCSCSLAREMRRVLTRYVIALRMIDKDGDRYYTRVCRKTFELWTSAYDHLRWCLDWGG